MNVDRSRSPLAPVTAPGNVPQSELVMVSPPKKTLFSAVWSSLLPFFSLSSSLNSSRGSEETCPLPPTPCRPRWGPLSAGPHSLSPDRCLTAQETRSVVTLRLTFSLPSLILVQVLRACNKVSHQFNQTTRQGWGRKENFVFPPLPNLIHTTPEGRGTTLTVFVSFFRWLPP